MKIRNSIIANIIIMVIISCIFVVAISYMLGIYTKHNQEITIPNIKGLSVEKAIDKLSQKKLNYEIVDSVYRNDLPHGVVIETLPHEGLNVKEGRKIYITINAFSTMQGMIPKVENMSSRQALSQLKAMKFNNIQIKEVDGDFDNLCLRIESQKGEVIPSGSKISIDTPIVLVVSKKNNSDSIYYNNSEEDKANVDNDWM